MYKRMTRRDLLRGAAVVGPAALLAACQPKVVEKIVEKEVTKVVKEVIKEVVKETVVVAGTPQVVEKEVTRVVEKEVTAPPAKASEGPGVVRLSVWGFQPDMVMYTGMVQKFEQMQEEVKVSLEQYAGGYYEKILANFAAGNAADIMYFQGWVWQPYPEDDLLLEMDGFIERDGVSDWWPDFESYQQATRWKDHTYMTPTDTGGWAMYYNKDLFDKQGVPYPTDDWTWEEFQAAVVSLTHQEGDDTYYGYGTHNWYPFMWLLPARKDGLLEWDRIVEPTKAQWSQPGIVEPMQWFAVDTVQNGWQPSPSVLAGGGISVWSGRAAMCFDGPWYLPYCWGEGATKEGGLNYDIAMLPKGKSGKSEGMPFIHGHCMAKVSKQPEASWELLKYILDDEGQEAIAQGGRQCGRPDMMEKYWAPIATEKYHFSNAQAFIRALLEGRQPIIAGQGADLQAMTAAGGPMPLAQDKMVAGTPAKEALEELDEGCQAILDKYWEKRG